MVFNSLSYFIFLPLVFLLFTKIKDNYRWFVLLLSSYVFYGFFLKPILLIALTAVILVTFRIGWLIDQSEDRFGRRMYLWAGILVNIALLVYFKYLTFIVQNLNLLLKYLSIDIIFEKPLPLISIGLSFYIFQAISYLADIYFRMAKPEQHFGYFALYMAFFPKLLQGPIERACDLIPQLKAKYIFNYSNMRSGMLLFVWGLFKKLVIADRLGLYVDAVYNDVHTFTGLPLLLATYAFAFQIYMDFSGYTDMARGSARLFNIDLTQNFNNPYLAKSVADFWRRWHISFSRWILDYIFEPLQMQFRNMGKLGIVTALVTTFILAGIWHGANWTFVVFGIIHGIYLATSFLYKPHKKKLYKALGIVSSRALDVWQIFVTFNLVCFTLIFFRANNIWDALYVSNNFYNVFSNYALARQIGINQLISQYILRGYSQEDLVYIVLALCIIVFVNYIKTGFYLKPTWYRWLCYYLLIFSVVIMGITGGSSYIYFKF